MSLGQTHTPGEETDPETGERAIDAQAFVTLMMGTGYGKSLLVVTDRAARLAAAACGGES